MDHPSLSWGHLDPSWAYLGANLGAEGRGTKNVWGVGGGVVGGVLS